MSNITNKYVEKYIKDLLPEEEGLLDELIEYALKNNIPIVQKEVRALLKVLTKTCGAKRILEVGTAIGFSAILLWQAMENPEIVLTIERDENMIIQAKNNIERAGLADKIRIIPGDALEVLQYMESSFDLIFLDGAKGHYKEMLHYCIHLLNPGGILVSDNILFQGMVASDSLVKRRKKTIVNRMRNYLNYICSHPQLITTIIPIGDGVAVSYKKQEE